MKINNICPDYPEYLKIIQTIANAPKRLWYIGSIPHRRLPTVAIIGTRRPTAYGQMVAHKLAYQLAKQGVVIVSGLALGVDAIAHRAALEAGGTTIAIMPGGLTHISPRSNYNLAVDIIKNGGMLLSDYAPEDPIYKQNFIARNRIVSGISDGLLVIEATAKSGTMHTASFALEQGRAVMAVPGNITSAASEGCNNLIKRGALAVTDVNDIFAEIGLATARQTSLPLGNSPQEQSLLQLLFAGESDGDVLQQKSKLPSAAFSQTLTMLELSGKIRALGANQWSLK
ncbi:MAG TPA: DNA-processing protein DprA [Candidatus Saccharimonadales bacterium]|nr:DNA-processing protein DprA [Candidatus Saccharimonadales bacterium]